ncbi:hypothetical protein M404DRAFT_236234 [Pisolithus tinctorius Marx 270]|uniref:Uncharacterized protein n=1 Tax=Pisolithus tinctorius Marx 270 TaxID=870435 RepID=A0A0C3P9F6_PISTI|nr:hypothetical protein M404DRAFT_236234 [Pisolithus tinctorius Marx 270]
MPTIHCHRDLNRTLFSGGSRLPKNVRRISGCSDLVNKLRGEDKIGEASIKFQFGLGPADSTGPQDNTEVDNEQGKWLILPLRIWTSRRIARSNFISGSRWSRVERLCIASRYLAQQFLWIILVDQVVAFRRGRLHKVLRSSRVGHARFYFLKITPRRNGVR